MEHQPQHGRPHRQEEEQREICPRCQSARTKFCYYNNYSTKQPRYYCKTCKRYWTKGGALRNVPIGGESRKAKRRRRRSTTSDDPSPSTSVPVSAPPPPPPVSFPANHLQLQQEQEQELMLQQQIQGNGNGEDPAVFPAIPPPAVYYTTGVGVGLAGGGLLPSFPVFQQPLINNGFHFQAMGSAPSFSNPSLHDFHFQLSQQHHQQYQPQQQHLLAMEESLLLQVPSSSTRPATATSSSVAASRRTLMPNTFTAAAAADVGFWNSNVSWPAGGRSGQWPPSSSANSFM